MAKTDWETVQIYRNVQNLSNYLPNLSQSSKLVKISSKIPNCPSSAYVLREVHSDNDASELVILGQFGGHFGTIRCRLNCLVRHQSPFY